MQRMPISDADKQKLKGRFPNCPYHQACDNGIERGFYPAYWCQCHHGRALTDPEFRHQAMIAFAQERGVALEVVERAMRSAFDCRGAG
jgi:hypothetical protein